MFTKKVALFALSSLLGGAILHAHSIEMHWLGTENDFPPVRHFLPRNPNVSNILSVEKEDTSILIEYRGSDFTELGVRIKDEDGQVIYEDMTSEATLQLPLPDSGYYTIEVRVDDTLYIGYFTI